MPAHPDSQIHMEDSSRRIYIIDNSTEGKSHWPHQSINKVNIRLTNLEGYWVYFPVFGGCGVPAGSTSYSE